MRVGTVVMAFGIALGGWITGAIFDLSGSYEAAFVHGILWNRLNIGIAVTLLAQPKTPERVAGGSSSSNRRVVPPRMRGLDARRKGCCCPVSENQPECRGNHDVHNALCHGGARPGDTVAVLGVSGLGHLGVQFASKMGFQTVAIARGGDKASLARKLGTQHYIDTQTSDPAAQLTRMGGARVILATVTSSTR